MINQMGKVYVVALILIAAALGAYVFAPSSSVNFSDLEHHLQAGNTTEVVKRLKSVPIADDQANKYLIDWALSNQEQINALVLFDVSRRVFVKDKHEGAKLFFAARLWMAYDGARCKDKSAANGLSLLAASANEVQKYLRDNPDEKQTALAEAIEWEKKHPSQVSPMWVCMRGMGNYLAAIDGEAPRVVQR
ncbi:MAG: hypothetical protein JKY27_09770 [Magnetovibrio sp.]|nr:hypothetical protein [Magnetovibrio sp.]